MFSSRQFCNLHRKNILSPIWLLFEKISLRSCWCICLRMALFVMPHMIRVFMILGDSSHSSNKCIMGYFLALYSAESTIFFKLNNRWNKRRSEWEIKNVESTLGWQKINFVWLYRGVFYQFCNAKHASTAQLPPAKCWYNRS